MEATIRSEKKMERLCRLTCEAGSEQHKIHYGYDEETRIKLEDCYISASGPLMTEKDKASIDIILRIFKIGFNRAFKMMSKSEEVGVVSPEEGTMPKKYWLQERDF